MSSRYVMCVREVTMSFFCFVWLLTLSLVNQYVPVATREVVYEKQYIGLLFNGLYTWNKDASPKVVFHPFFDMNGGGECSRAFWLGHLCIWFNYMVCAILGVSMLLTFCGACFNPLPVSCMRIAAGLLGLGFFLSTISVSMAIAMYRMPLCTAPLSETVAYQVYELDVALPLQNHTWIVSGLIPVMALTWLSMGIMCGCGFWAEQPPGVGDWWYSNCAKPPKGHPLEQALL